MTWSCDAAGAAAWLRVRLAAPPKHALPPFSAPRQALLETQLAGCARQLAVVQWEHEYIKDQLTTTEVRAGPASSQHPRLSIHACLVNGSLLQFSVRVQWLLRFSWTGGHQGQRRDWSAWHCCSVCQADGWAEQAWPWPLQQQGCAADLRQQCSPPSLGRSPVTLPPCLMLLSCRSPWLAYTTGMCRTGGNRQTAAATAAARDRRTQKASFKHSSGPS